MSRPTITRWGRSSTETDAGREADRGALSALGEVVADDSDAEIVIVGSKTQVGAARLEAAPSVRLVITGTSGYEHLDLDALAGRSILAARCPLARRDAVVDSALMMLLAGIRRLGVLQEAGRSGTWARGDLWRIAPSRLRDLRVGVVGLGVIGIRMAEVLRALGAEVVGSDPRVEGSSDARDVLRSCDAVTLHCDLNPSTRGLVDAGLLTEVRPGLVLVNTARGALVDVDAAVAALDAGQLGALGIDVFPSEPWPGLATLAARPDCCVTPHAAGYHTGLAEAVRAELVATVSAWVAGGPLPFPVG